MNKKTRDYKTMMIRNDVIRHHVMTDNERLREALRTIRDLAEEGRLTPHTMANIGRIARAALIQAAPENLTLRAPDTEGHTS
jgi:hypothetical protein